MYITRGDQKVRGRALLKSLNFTLAKKTINAYAVRKYFKISS